MSYASKIYSNHQNETDVSTANSNELIILVYERILENLRIGKREIEAGEYGINYFARATELINLGLLTSLNHEKGGEIAANLDKIYRWALQEINLARVEKSAPRVGEVINTFTTLYDAWSAIIPKKQKTFTMLQT